MSDFAAESWRAAACQAGPRLACVQNLTASVCSGVRWCNRKSASMLVRSPQDPSRSVPVLILVVALLMAVTGPAQPNQTHDAAPMTIRGLFNGQLVTVTASHRTAGAIEFLRWGGIEFINAYDHGRELQSAASFDGLTECDNPTEAGSRRDGEGPRSSSLLHSGIVTATTSCVPTRKWPIGFDAASGRQHVGTPGTKLLLPFPQPRQQDSAVPAGLRQRTRTQDHI